MRPTAALVNTARGSIVDEQTIVAAQHERTIAGAALDVYEHEPGDVRAALARDVVLTPHLGSATLDTLEAMGLLAVGALRAVLVDGVTPPNLVR
jgi:lactate dehydrogenase-like 2-hydroxyacid dehydrogenase